MTESRFIDGVSFDGFSFVITGLHIPHASISISDKLNDCIKRLEDIWPDASHTILVRHLKYCMHPA